MKIIKFFKWVGLVVILFVAGLKIIAYSTQVERDFRVGYEHYAAAAAAVAAGDYQTGYSLYLQSSFEFDDPQLKAVALYETATVGWTRQIANYDILVDLYQQSLRFSPGFYEPSFDLEYLYTLSGNAPQELPQPEPGPQPSSEGRPTNGDI